jgi:ABC-type cobalamin/Fe3+-siderophores transport system ATPase subunit
MPVKAQWLCSAGVGGSRMVDDVTVDVRTGEVLAVAGPCGAGKSSFLRLLNRLDEPTSGTAERNRLPPDSAARIAPPCGNDTQTGLSFPGIDSLRSLGIVRTPGLMAGMPLSGARPIYAAQRHVLARRAAYAAAPQYRGQGLILTVGARSSLCPRFVPVCHHASTTILFRPHSFLAW